MVFLLRHSTTFQNLCFSVINWVRCWINKVLMPNVNIPPNTNHVLLFVVMYMCCCYSVLFFRWHHSSLEEIRSLVCDWFGLLCGHTFDHTIHLIVFHLCPNNICYSNISLVLPSLGIVVGQESTFGFCCFLFSDCIFACCECTVFIMEIS